MRQLTHGYINHGFQFVDPALARQPCSYYSTNSGFGLAVRLHPRGVAGGGFNIGVLGLGAGTIAAYANTNDSVRFYEINPAVIRFAAGPRPHFTYLKDCRGRASVTQGDARLVLERELAAHQTNRFDILVMDAFSGDSVPVHLLTVEAFEMYWRHMRDNEGIIAVNISNRFLDFEDLMAAIGHRFRMHVIIIDSRGDPPDFTPSRWCLFTRSAPFASHPEVRRVAQPPRAKPVAVWTDQFSNLFELLK
jgi:spermidine synthase